MMIDMSKMGAQELRNLMENAKRLGREDVYRDAFQKLCEVLPGAEVDGLDMNNVVFQKFWKAVHAAEQVRTEQRGKTIRLQRTRNKVQKKGIVVTMEDLARSKTPSDGFHILLDGGLPHLVFEHIIAEHPDHFSAGAVAAARKRLVEYSIPLPE